MVKQAPAQGKISRVHDPCTDNTTVYTRLNDSDYHVESHYKDILVFRGAVTRPDTGEQFPGIFYYSGNGKTTMKYQGLCEFYNTDRSLDKRAYFINGNPTEIWKYDRGMLIKHEKKDGKSSLVQHYSHDSLRLEYIEDYRKRTQTNRVILNGKILETVFIYDDETFSYKPLKKHTTIYSPDGSIQMKLVKFPRSNKTRYEYRYSNTKIYQDPEHNFRLNQLTEYDRKGNEVRIKTYEFTGKKDRVRTDTRYTRKYDYMGQLLYERSIETFRGTEADTFEFIRDTLAYELRAKEFSYSYVFRLSPDASSATLVSRSFDNSRTTRIFNYKDGKAIMRYYENNVLLRSRTIYEYNFYISTETFRTMRPEDIESYFPELHRMYNHSLLEEEREYYSEWDDEEQQVSFMRDTIFYNGGVIGIETMHRDTFERYYLDGNALKLGYSTHAYRVAKDIELCAEGIKGPGGWVVPPRFEYVQKYGYDTGTLYFAGNKDFISIYDWKGNLLLPPTEGILVPEISYYYEYHFIQLGQELKDSLGLKRDELFIINLPQKREFYILSLDNKVILSMPENISSAYESQYYYFEENENRHFTLTDTFGKIGYFDLKGLYISPKYNSLTRISNGEFIAQYPNGNFHFLDRLGKPKAMDSFPAFMKSGDTAIITLDIKNRPRLLSLRTMQYQGERASYEFSGSFRQNHAYIRQNSLNGVVDMHLKVLVPPLYKKIIENNGQFIARNSDTFDFYDWQGRQLNRLVCDSLYSQDYENVNRMLFRKNSKYGLVNRSGKILVQPKYDNIGVYGDVYFLINSNEGNPKAIEIKGDSLSVAKLFPALYGVPYADMAIRDKGGIINFKGELTASNVDRPNGSYDRFSLNTITSNGQFLGNMNSLGEWVFKTSKYNRTHQITPGIFYTLDHSGMAGVIDCGGKDLVPAIYKHISFDHENKLLWHTTDGTPVYSAYGKIQDVWKLTSLNTHKTMPDTFRHPVHFTGSRAIVKNNHGLAGVIDTGFNKVLPFDFTSFRMLSRQHYAFNHKDGSLWVTDLDFRLINKLHLDKVMSLYPQGIVGFSQSKIFLLDSNFKLVDSSARYFSDRESDMFLRDGFAFAQRPDTESGYEYDYTEEESGEEEEYHEWMLPGVFNFLASVELYESSLGESDNFSEAGVFPQPQYNHYSTLPHFPLMSWITSPDYYLFSLNDIVYRPKPFTFERSKLVQNMAYGSHRDRFVTITHNPPPNSSDQWHNTSFYVDPASGVYFVPLDELIAYKKTTQFILLLKKYLSKMDAKEISCFPNSDYMEFFTHKFAFDQKGIRFILNDEFSFIIPFSELKPLMHPYWAKRI